LPFKNEFEDMNIDEMNKCLSKLCVSVRKKLWEWLQKIILHGDTSGSGYTPKVTFLKN
jgi:hypothetical protein